jgi:hypothetical protein
MPSKRNSIASDTREGSPRPPDSGAEVQAPATRPAPTPRTSRGAATVHAPRKTELHRFSVSPRPLPSREQIAQRAYELWMLSGCCYGRDDENWLQAERELSTGC